MGSSLPQSLQNMLPQLQQVAHASTSSPSIIVRKATVLPRSHRLQSTRVAHPQVFAQKMHPTHRD
jgi:hypothetical protein